MQPIRKTRVSAEQKYRELRRQARQAVIESLRRMSSDEVGLSDITEEALVQADAWQAAYPLARHGYTPGWTWRTEVRRFGRRPRRVEVALWYDKVLCGLALGRISDRCVVATIHFVEASPVDNPLQGKVAPFILRYLEALAVLAGCSTVTLERPVEGLHEFYRDLGYANQVTKGATVVRQFKRLSTTPMAK